MVRQSIVLSQQIDGLLDDNILLWRTERREFESDGKLRSTDIKTLKVDKVEGVRVAWLVARDDRPLPGNERREVEAKMRKRVAELKRSPEKAARSSEMDFLVELPDALDFKYSGTERIAGREALILDFSPRPGYTAKRLRARVFEKCRGRVWIDKADKQAVKVNAEIYDTVSIGFGLLAKIEKGTQFHLEQVRLNDEDLWVPHRETIRFDARVMVFKTVKTQIDTTVKVVPKQNLARR